MLLLMRLRWRMFQFHQTIVQIGLALLERQLSFVEILFALGTGPTFERQMRMFHAAATSVGTSDHHEGTRSHDGFIIVTARVDTATVITVVVVVAV